MKYLSLALIVMSVSALPVVGVLAAAYKEKDFDCSGWLPVAVFIVLTSALAMFS